MKISLSDFSDGLLAALAVRGFQTFYAPQLKRAMLDCVSVIEAEAKKQKCTLDFRIEPGWYGSDDSTILRELIHDGIGKCTLVFTSIHEYKLQIAIGERFAAKTFQEISGDRAFYDAIAKIVAEQYAKTANPDFARIG